VKEKTSKKGQESRASGNNKQNVKNCKKMFESVKNDEKC